MTLSQFIVYSGSVKIGFGFDDGGASPKDKVSDLDFQQCEGIPHRRRSRNDPISSRNGTG